MSITKKQEVIQLKQKSKQMSPNALFQLPSELLSSIYEYDNTYRKIFSNEVVQMIWGSALKRSLISITLPDDSFLGCVDDVYESDNESSPDIQKGTDAVKFAAEYMFRNMGFFDNYVKNKCHYGIGNDFYTEDLSSKCIELYDYVYDDLSAKIDKFTKRSFISVRLYLKNKMIFDGGIYFDVAESDNDENDNIIVVNYDNKRRMALFQYIN